MLLIQDTRSQNIFVTYQRRGSFCDRHNYVRRFEKQPSDETFSCCQVAAVFSSSLSFVPKTRRDYTFLHLFSSDQQPKLRSCLRFISESDVCLSRAHKRRVRWDSRPRPIRIEHFLFLAIILTLTANNSLNSSEPEVNVDTNIREEL